MRRNTSCGCNDHKCPPAKPCDKAKVKRVDCFSDSFAPEVFEPQNFPVIDVPVVLAEVELEANIESDIKLPTPAREIKNIRKNVSLKQCKAIAVPQFPNSSSKLVKVFITGVLHKNIEYVEDCSGVVKHHSADVEFTCNETVRVFNRPVQFFSIKNSVDEIRFLDKKGHGADRCVFGQFTDEDYNEPIECKPIFTEVLELDLIKDFDRFGRFNKITEKVEVFLLFKLLQTQQFDPTLFCPPHDLDGDDHPINASASNTKQNRYRRLRNNH